MIISSDILFLPGLKRKFCVKFNRIVRPYTIWSTIWHADIYSLYVYTCRQIYSFTLCTHHFPLFFSYSHFTSSSCVFICSNRKKSSFTLQFPLLYIHIVCRVYVVLLISFLTLVSYLFSPLCHTNDYRHCAIKTPTDIRMYTVVRYMMYANIVYTKVSMCFYFLLFYFTLISGVFRLSANKFIFLDAIFSPYIYGI